MYRTSTRPAPLVLPPFSLARFDLDRRRDGGLQTPPADSMAATFPHSQYYEYPSRRDNTYSTNGASGNSYSASHAASRPYTTLPLPEPTSNLRQELSRNQPPYSRSQSPVPAERGTAVMTSEEHVRRKSAAGDMIRPNLQIPSSISADGGSLPDFAAQITCLFWFENIETLHKAERLSQSSSPVRRLREEAIPSIGFRKWVVTILSTTQVTDKVIILALLFIYRLKTFNSTVKGRTGSEYRLLTVALMLGNKFLDDNTYTNKTWAEVSGISVTEIHVMEVEFLSNMRYSLLASQEQWKEWHEKLRKFKTYCDLAARAPVAQPSPLAAPNPPPPMPSPPESMQSSSPPTSVAYPPATNSNQWAAAPPLVPLPSLLALPENSHRQPRKRSFDGDTEEPVAKRVTRPLPPNQPSYPTAAAAPIRTEPPRLPVPNLTIATNHQPASNGYTTGANSSQILLPPLGSRAMSTVYPSSNPTTPSSWAPSVPMLTPSNSNTNGYSTPSRRQSPHSVQELLSYNSSPINANFPHHNPGHISPSVFLQQRSSPFKPVQHVSTLLYPPPSGSLHDYSVNINQMHYQPLGKRNDYRSGVVPDYASHTPYQTWPVLRQPNFHA